VSANGLPAPDAGRHWSAPSKRRPPFALELSRPTCLRPNIIPSYRGEIRPGERRRVPLQRASRSPASAR
jgi:hypothetical protein